MIAHAAWTGRLRRLGGRRGLGSVSADTAWAGCLRRLAGCLRAGSAPRAALIRLHAEAAGPTRVPLARLARRLRLGEPAGRALTGLAAELPEARALVTVWSVHTRLGGDLPAIVDHLAATAERRAAEAAGGRAAAAGALLSGRLVCALPLVLVVLAPAARAPLFDVTGMAMLAAGVGLITAGMMWIDRLVPRPPAGDDLPAFVAEVLAAALEGGAPLGFVLGAVAATIPGPVFEPVRRRVRLGASWPSALAASGDRSVAALGQCIEGALDLGTPIARTLAAFAADRRAAGRRRFEAALKRAPVLMVMPLSFCVLPAYALLGLGPYLRSLHP